LRKPERKEKRTHLRSSTSSTEQKQKISDKYFGRRRSGRMWVTYGFGKNEDILAAGHLRGQNGDKPG